MSWFTYGKFRQPGPGAMSQGLLTYRLPVDSAVGLGTLHGALRITQKPVLKSHADVWTDGYGGLQAGQTYMQSLADLDANGVATSDPALGDTD